MGAVAGGGRPGGSPELGRGEEVGSGYQGPRVKRGKVVFRFKGKRPKTVHGLYGPVTLTRAYYASGNGETWVPLDEQLGIGDGQTPACEYHLGQFAGLAPYQRSLRAASSPP